MMTTLIGYARFSTDKQDLATQKAAREKLGVAAERIYTDYGLTGMNWSRTRGLLPTLSSRAASGSRWDRTFMIPSIS